MRKIIVAFTGFVVLSVSAQLANAQASDDVRQRIDQMKSNDPGMRLNAVDSLAKMPEKASDAIPVLTELYLGDSDVNVRRRARTVLGQIKLARRAKSDLPPPSAAVDGGGPLSGVSKNMPPAAPDEPKGRVAELVKQLKANPDASMKASEELGRMGVDAKPACSALIEVMMKKDARWHEARLAATEALEKIHPKLKAPVLKIILTPESEFNPDKGELRAIAELGPDGRGSLPLLMDLWSLDPSLGLHANGTLLQTLHKVAPTEKVVTDQVVGVVRGKVAVGIECYVTALDILDKRGLAMDDVADLYLAVLVNPEAESVFRLPGPMFRIGCQRRLQAMVNLKQIKPEKVLKPFIACLSEKNFELRKGALIALGEFGSASKEAIPLVRQLKLEDPDERIRGAAAAALVGIER